jgi:uncharacterized protein (DUF302 family)
MNHPLIFNIAKSFEEARCDPKAALASHDFSLLAIHDLAGTLHSKQISFSENHLIFELCNPQQAASVLNVDMSLSMALPCRSCVYTDAGQTRIGMILAVDLLRSLSESSELIDVTQHSDNKMTSLINELAASTSVCSSW